MRATDTTNDELTRRLPEYGREIGPVGTITRVVAGIAAIALVVWDGVGLWDLPGLLAAPFAATVAARLIIRGREAAPADVAAAVPAGCVLVGVLFGASSVLGATTAVDGDVVFWGFVGASMLFGAARGDAGCELLAFPNAITGRRDRIGCILFTPIDAAEARGSVGRPVGDGAR